MSDPISRLQFARQERPRVRGLAWQTSDKVAAKLVPPMLARSCRQTKPSRERAGTSKGQEKPTDYGRTERSRACSMMPSPLFREGTGQAQESAKRWIVIVRQPCRTELDQFIISRNRSKHHLWKRRRDRRFAGKADAETHGHRCWL